MNFNSLSFLIFLPTVLVLYYVIPQRFRWILLLAASYYFYMSWNPTLILLIAGTTLVTYLAGLFMPRAKTPALKKTICVAALIYCLGVLVFFKYFNFLMENAAAFLRLFAMDVSWRGLDIILPVGISFYTFQTLSYVLDVYKGKIEPEKHLGYYALFVSFFPQLVAGPIERPGDLIPQLKAEHKLNWEDFTCGLRILAVGFFYKCVAADFLAIYVNRAFAAPEEGNALSVFLAGFLFTSQMYCDFAGYSEIATGAARMMGIRLSRNFYRPYAPESYSDFFRRWHITLTRWFTDYVYIPLGGNRKGMGRRIFNTYVVFLLCGLWHGANWTYVLWGAYAATFLTVEMLLHKPLKAFFTKHPVSENRSLVRGLKIVAMYLILVPAGIIFRADSISHAWQMLSRLFTGLGFGSAYLETVTAHLGLTPMIMLQLALVIAAEVLVWHFAEIGRDKPAPVLTEDAAGRSMAANRLLLMVYIMLAVIFFWLALLASGDTSAFQYFQF